MTHQLKALFLFLAAVAILAVAGVQHVSGVRTQVPQEKLAEQAYRNIQVFKGVPATQLLGVMNYMAGTLGVSCNHCHVPNQFAKDDKPAKQIARRHILMTRSLNDSTFAGQAVVNCATCHRGETRPDSRLVLPPNDRPPMNTTPAEPLPSLDEILERYGRALGGQAKIEKLKTLTITGTRVTTMGREPSQTEKLEIYRKAPNKLRMTFSRPGNDSTQAFNGAEGWRNNNGRISAIAGPDLFGAQRDANFYKDINLRQEYSQMAVVGKEKVGDRDCYVIEATLPEKSPARMMFGIQSEKLYFDIQTGLLVRRYMEYATLFGPLPEATDYGDYRRLKGVTLPFVITLSRPPMKVIQKIEAIKLDQPIRDEMFDKPVSAARP
jgi:outer membrane lipoprotein-sorting protein